MTIIFLLTICLILGISLVIVIQDLFKLEKRLHKTEDENNGFKNSLQKEADIVLEDAHKRAMHLIDEANRKAMEIVSSSETYTAESKQALKDSINAVTKTEIDQINRLGHDILSTYQATLQNVQKEGNEVVTTITKDLEKQAAEQITAFTNSVRQETAASEKEIQVRITREYELAKNEVASYKQAQMQKAQDQLFDLIRFLTEAALGRGLTLEQHQNLAIDALKEAKSQGVIR